MCCEFWVWANNFSRWYIVITGVNSDGLDQFSFVLLTDVVTGTTINFTDNGWESSGSFRGFEGTITWPATSDLSCGTQIIITDNSPYSTSIGSVTDAGLDLSASSGDQILAYQGLSTSPTFLYAIHFGSTTDWTDATNANTSAIPTGLTNGVNAIYIGDRDNGIYNCSVTNSPSLILASVSDINNWSGNNDTPYTLGGCTFTCNTCSTTTTWTAGAWSAGLPDINTNAVIDAFYNTSAGGSQVSFSACSLTVTTNGFLLVADNTFVEVQNDITVDAGGEFAIQPYGAVLQVDDLATTNNSGDMYVIKKTAPANAWYEYTYWSSPVKNETIGGGLFESNIYRRFSFNAQNFLDATAETGNNNATVAGQDDIDDSNDDWIGLSGTTPMVPGVGYAATHDPLIFASSFGNQIDYVFEGEFNSGVVSVPVFRNDGSVLDKNWNFIGNPYPSAISVASFFAQNKYDATTNPTGTLEGAIYYWSQNTPPSNAANGNETSNFSNSDYAMFNGTGGSAGGDLVTPSAYIPSGQGFFISFSQARPTNTGTVVFNNAMRVKGTTNNSQFFKNSNTKGKSNTVTANKLWLNVTSDTGLSNQILVGYVDGATNNDDGEYYDAFKITTYNTPISLYSIIEGSDKKFAIQGKDANSINENETIKLGFKSTVNVATLFKLSVAQLEGDFLNSNHIYLKDNLLNKTHCLSTSDYTFTSAVGEFNNRFEVTFSNQALAIEDVLSNKNTLKIIELQNDYVQFNTSNNLNIKTVTIFDMLGRQLYSFKGNSTSETYKLSNLNNSIFVAKVELSNGAVISKKSFKK